MTDKEYGIALNALERVILTQPTHAGAWLDIAHIHHTQRNKNALRETLNAINLRFTLPPAIENVVDQYQNWLNEGQTQQTPPLLNILTEFEAGYSDNINNGSKYKRIRLIDIELELSDSSRPIADQFYSTLVQADYSVNLNEWQTVSWLALKKIHHNTHHDHDRDWAMLGLSGQKKLSSHEALRLSAYGLHVDSRNQDDQTIHWLQAHYQKQHNSDQTTSGWLSTQSTSLNNSSRYRKYTLGSKHSIRSGRWINYASIAPSYEARSTNTNGGDQTTIKFELGSKRQFTNQSQLSVSLQHQLDSDQSPYNPVLFGTRKRNLRETELTFEYNMLPAKDQTVTFWTTYNYQTSDIELFNSQSWQGGIRWQLYWR